MKMKNTVYQIITFLFNISAIIMIMVFINHPNLLFANNLQNDQNNTIGDDTSSESVYYSNGNELDGVEDEGNYRNPKVVVLDFVNLSAAGVEEQITIEAPNYIAEGLADSQKFEVIDRELVSMAIRMNQWDEKELFTKSRAAEVGRSFKADLAVIGKYRARGNNFDLWVWIRVIDVQTEEIVFEYNYTSQNRRLLLEDHLFVACDEFLDKMEFYHQPIAMDEEIITETDITDLNVGFYLRAGVAPPLGDITQTSTGGLPYASLSIYWGIKLTEEILLPFELEIGYHDLYVKEEELIEGQEIITRLFPISLNVGYQFLFWDFLEIMPKLGVGGMLFYIQTDNPTVLEQIGQEVSVQFFAKAGLSVFFHIIPEIALFIDYQFAVAFPATFPEGTYIFFNIPALGVAFRF